MARIDSIKSYSLHKPDSTETTVLPGNQHILLYIQERPWRLSGILASDIV